MAHIVVAHSLLQFGLYFLKRTTVPRHPFANRLLLLGGRARRLALSLLRSGSPWARPDNHSEHELVHCTCPLLTQSGHGLSRYTHALPKIWMPADRQGSGS